jgi:hypothetical protein
MSQIKAKQAREIDINKWGYEILSFNLKTKLILTYEAPYNISLFFETSG